MPLPLTVSCFSKIHIGFTFLVGADPGSFGKRAVKRVCVFSGYPHSPSSLTALEFHIRGRFLELQECRACQ